MQDLRNPVKPLWLALLALLALVSEASAWWWAALQAEGTSLQGPLLLGLTGVMCAMAVFVVLWRQIPQARRETTKTRQLLASALDTLDVGLEIWDAKDRLVLYNKKINLMYPDLHEPAHIGQTFEALVRDRLRRHEIPVAIGREPQWLERHLASRGRHNKLQLKEIQGNRWVNTCETRTPEGYLVASWVDVTELVNQSKVLEASNQQLAQQSTMDELTGLANRRRFDEALVTEWQRAARSVTPLSLLMVDIDHFKQFNDNYGHVAGDKCLRQVAGVLDQCVRRAGELVARYGGEEFVVLLPGANMADACDTANKCMELMHALAIPHAASETSTQVTFSIGVACLLPDATLEPSSMVNAADTAMYRAKNGGRARFEVADQADWEIENDTPRTRPAPLSIR